MTTPDLLKVTDLSVCFDTQAGPIEPVRGISFRVRAGSTVAIVGESGSGKSVTAQAIMGILPSNGRITGGEILFSDPKGVEPTFDLAALNPASAAYRRVRGDRISMIFQEPMTSLSPLHTIGDQIGEALRIHRGMSKGEAKRAAIQMIATTGFPDPGRAFDTYPFELSGGLRQRAMISMALACGPSLLIADEPTTALDVTIQAQILKLMRDLQQALGMAVLIITHDLGVVANVAEEIIVAYQGQIMESGTLDDIFRAPRHEYLKGLLNAVPHFDMKDGERLRPLREIEHKTARLLVNDGKDRMLTSGRPLLEVKGLTKSFGVRKGNMFGGGGDVARIRAVEDVNLRIFPGECLGLVGESGCGKTTLSKLIMRAIDADAGQLLLDGPDGPVDLMKMNEDAMRPYRTRVQYMFQDPFGSLNPRMTVRQILSEPLAIHHIGDAAYRQEMVEELLELVGLDPRFVNRYPHSFSGGQRQRIGIARALALKPDLLICDEPVSALDVSVQAQILNLLKDLQRELGLTYLFISHNLAVVDYVANRIAVMYGGRIVETAPRELLFKGPRHPYTQALLTAVPYPDPDRKLDFAKINEDRVTDPDAWPEPFNENLAKRMTMVDVGGGHLVAGDADHGGLL